MCRTFGCSLPLASTKLKWANFAVGSPTVVLEDSGVTRIIPQSVIASELRGLAQLGHFTRVERVVGFDDCQLAFVRRFFQNDTLRE